MKVINEILGAIRLCDKVEDEVKHFIGGGSVEVKSVKSFQTHQAVDTPQQGVMRGNKLMNTVIAEKHILFLPSMLPPKQRIS